MNEGKLIKGLVKIAEDFDLKFEDVNNVFNRESKKLTARAYSKTLSPDINAVRQQAYDVVGRFYQVHYKNSE